MIAIKKLLTPLVLLSLAGCADEAAKGEGASGEVRLQVGRVPVGVRALNVRVLGARLVEECFELVPGTNAVLTMGTLPFGMAEVSAVALADGCGDVGAQTPTHVSQRVVVEIKPSFITTVRLLMLQNGQAAIVGEFEDFGAGGAPGAGGEGPSTGGEAPGAGNGGGGGATGSGGVAGSGGATGSGGVAGSSGGLPGLGGSSAGTAGAATAGSGGSSAPPLPPTTHTLSLKVTGSGSVSIPFDPVKVCTGSCTGTFVAGSRVTLSVQSGTLQLWKGDCVGSENSARCTLLMDRDRSAEATFTASQPNPPNPPNPVELFTWRAATLNPIPLTVPSNGVYQLRVNVSSGPTSAQVTIRRDSPPGNPSVGSVACQVSAALDPPCSATTNVTLSASDRYLVDFKVTDLRTGGTTIGGVASLLK